MSDIWFVRAGRESVYAEDFMQKKVVGIGWAEIGDLEPNITKAQLLQIYKQTYPEHSDGKAQVCVSQILRFMQEIKVGDSVMTHDRDKQMYYLGIISSECHWNPTLMGDLPRVRSVDWKYQIPRGLLSGDAKSTLGAIQTLFLVRGKVASELNDKAISLQQPSKSDIVSFTTASIPDQTDLEQEIRAELLEKSEQAIEDRIVRLEWDQVQELVAGILRAMGYRTTISPRGSDRGVDIFASPDGLGLEEPRIFVEVKHRPTTSMGSQDIRSFLGGRSSGDKCLYVSTGGFTKEARYEADRANIAITLLGLVDLRKLLVDYYEKLDEDMKSLIPLKRIYVLAN
ncbi:MAG: restriction endonuclease [Anaerolineae bacterium]|nr:restriction endonuclease [Anaerolineales bacterium]MCQ3980125.1 type II restriction endonuclease [Anaerolineae bacterium]